VSDTTIPFTKNEALKTSGGSLPTGIDREDYEELLVTIREDGLQELTPQELDIVKQVIEHQKSTGTATPSQDGPQKAPEGPQPGY
jgi:hypothetical protein